MTNEECAIVREIVETVRRPGARAYLSRLSDSRAARFLLHAANGCRLMSSFTEPAARPRS